MALDVSLSAKFVAESEAVIVRGSASKERGADVAGRQASSLPRRHVAFSLLYLFHAIN